MTEPCASDTQSGWSRLWPRLSLSKADATAFGVQPVVGTHDLHCSELFTDAALIELLDVFPRQNLYALTMGNDPEHPEENLLASHEGVSGAELLRAVYTGRLWLNITRVDSADRRYRTIVDRLYEQIAGNVPGFRVRSSQATLLVSSPGAMVYYHVDGPASALWHLRGRKRVCVYPAADWRYVEREALEDIFAGARHEYLPYSNDFDRGASVFDLNPGQWITWAQNAPHRVTHLSGINVSLSTEHFTERTRRRAQVYTANRLLRSRFCLRDLSTRETGPGALAKVVTHGLARRLGLNSGPPKRHVATMRVAAEVPGGVVPLAEVPERQLAGPAAFGSAVALQQRWRECPAGFRPRARVDER